MEAEISRDTMKVNFDGGQDRPQTTGLNSIADPQKSYPELKLTIKDIIATPGVDLEQQKKGHGDEDALIQGVIKLPVESEEKKGEEERAEVRNEDGKEKDLVLPFVSDDHLNNLNN